MAPSSFSDGSRGGLRDSSWSLFQRSARAILPVLICTESRDDTERLDKAIGELLSTYGFSEATILLSKDFRGSWLRLHVHEEIDKKADTIKRDITLAFGPDPSLKQVSPEKRQAFEKLGKLLAAISGFCIVGTLFLGTIHEASELVKKYHEVFPPEPISIVMPAPQDRNKVLAAELSQASIPAIVNADSDPEKLKFLIGYGLADQLQSPALADRRRFYPPAGDPPNPAGR